ncbi:hypothetical protein O181_021902 [Austropuccinia psidii MF-1]|uniref:Uncharacterized protein n=1 Tax=Austropuccinia psidii MF-1 TaxID=1389203 RepID=A0A9Q3GWM9_9BASI|nr:hypothetical protein [Austropuccinia psidii MF-1]
MPGELENALKCRCNQKCNIHDIANNLQDLRTRKNIGKYTKYKCNFSREKQPFRFYNKDKPREKVADVPKKKNSCHNYVSTDYYPKNFTKEKKKIYLIEEVPEEEVKAEDSESASMGDSIREKSYDAKRK